MPPNDEMPKGILSGLIPLNALAQPIPQAEPLLADDAFDNISRTKGLVLPASYFHYTSAAGLKGIVEENTLRFSDTKFVNDGSERQWGLDIFKEVVRKFEARSDERTNNFIGRMYDLESELSDDFRQIVFCMSRRGNLLNQWRDYGVGVVPYCIEFDAAYFNKVYQPDEAPFDPMPTFLVYDHDQQVALVEKAVEEILAIVRPVWDKMDRATFMQTADAASFQISEILQRFKNSAFEAEEEVRLRISHYRLKGKIPAKFRESALGLVPYYEWSPKAKLPIKSVMVGPSPHAQASLDALQVFLDTNHIEAKASTSNIPIRR